MENKDKIKLILQRWKSKNVMHDEYVIEAEITQVDADAKEIWEHFLKYPLSSRGQCSVVMAFDENKSVELASSELLYEEVTKLLEKQYSIVENALSKMCGQVEERLGEYIQTKETITAKQDVVNKEIEKLKETVKCIEFLKK